MCVTRRLLRPKPAIEVNLSALRIIIALSTVLAMSVGQILLKIAAQGMQNRDLSLSSVLFDKYLVIAFGVYGAAMVLWVALLRNTPLSLAYPILALAFIFVPVLEHLILGEQLRWQTILGATVIAAGVWISVVRP